MNICQYVHNHKEQVLDWEQNIWVLICKATYQLWGLRRRAEPELSFLNCRLDRPAWPPRRLIARFKCRDMWKYMNTTGSNTDATRNSNSISSWGILSHPWIVPMASTESGRVASWPLMRTSKPFFRVERILQYSVACPGKESLPKLPDVRDPPITLLKKLKGQMFLVYLHVKWVEYSHNGCSAYTRQQQDLSRNWTLTTV